MKNFEEARAKDLKLRCWIYTEFGESNFIGVLPKVFKSIVFPLFIRKQMNHEIDCIQNHPSAWLEALSGKHFHPVLLQSFFQVVPKRFQVRIRGAGGNDEAIGKGRLLAEVKEFEIAGLFVE